MLENDKISVIVPVYNASKYLEKCLRSIINQSYKNLEIILINDGSSDESLKICNKYKTIYSNIKVIDLIKNCGVSYARNQGILNLSGKYIIFIDADDWLEYNMIEILYSNLIESNSDISICDYYINYEDKEEVHNNLTDDEIIIDKEIMYKYLIDENYFGGYLWNKMFKKEIIDDFKLKFNEEVKICEDLLFIAELLKNINKIIYCPSQKLYHYRRTQSSAVNFSYSEKDTTKLIPLKYLIDNNIAFDRLFYDYVILNCQSIYILKKIGKNDEIMLKKMKKEAKKYFTLALKNEKWQKKIRVVLWYFFPELCGKIKDKKIENATKNIYNKC